MRSKTLSRLALLLALLVFTSTGCSKKSDSAAPKDSPSSAAESDDEDSNGWISLTRDGVERVYNRSTPRPSFSMYQGNLAGNGSSVSQDLTTTPVSTLGVVLDFGTNLYTGVGTYPLARIYDRS